MQEREETLIWGHHRLAYAGLTDRGMVREVNEDSFAILPEYPLFILADGMGGHEAGPLASGLAIECAKRYMAFMDDPEEATLPNGLTREMLAKAPLAGIAHYANSRVYHEAGDRIMGSTLLALHFVEDTADIMHIGDSRAYLWRDGKLEQLTEDHSFVYELMKAGEITREQMYTHPKRNIITRAVGTSAFVEPGLKRINVLPGDLFLLCSDGLTSMARDEEIERIIRLENNVANLTNTLVRLANEAGGRDNITVIVVSIR